MLGDEGSAIGYSAVDTLSRIEAAVLNTEYSVLVFPSVRSVDVVGSKTQTAV